MTLKEQIKNFTELFSKPSLPEKQFKIKDILFFSQFMKLVWKLAAISFTLAIATTIIKSVIPLGGKVFIDYVIMKQGYGQINSIMSLIGLPSQAQTVVQYLGSVDLVIMSMIIGGIFFGVLGAAQSYTTMRYGQELTFNIQKTLFERSLRFPLTIFKTKQTGYIASRLLGEVASIQSFFSSTVTSLISNIFFLLIGVIVMYLMSPKITLIILCVSPLYLVISMYFSNRIRSMSYNESEITVQVFRQMNEALAGIEVIKTSTAEDREIKKVSDKMRHALQTKIKSSIIFSTSSSMLRIIQFGIVILITWFGYGEIQRGAMTLGDFAAFTSYAYLLSGAISGLFSTILNIQPSLASMVRIKEMFDIELEYEQEDKTKIRPEKVNGDVRFEQVTFSYEANKPVMKDVSFTIKAGETVTLIGPSGLGKTTISSLILKFYTPQSGTIYLDDYDLNDVDTVWLRQQIGVVSQDIFLFNESIENNIRYGRPSATSEEVIVAAKAAGIHDSITDFPDGYQTIVGERGAKLSTGQRQRISIARAFLRNTPILVLDEPTSALDVETEQIIKESLKELVKGRTTFIISHRVSMTEVADRVLVISEGKVRECGTHEELLKEEGMYIRMRMPEPAA